MERIKRQRMQEKAQPIPAELVTKLLGHRVAVSPIVTVEPRRRKFHKPITLTIPVPQAATKGMINQYAGDAPTLRLLCSITGGTNKAQWEDVTGSTPLTFVNDCVSFTTTVSARFWLMDCRQVSEATKFATELYAEAMHVPFMAKFVVFAKRLDPMEAQLRVFCMTDDKEDKTLESQEHFTEVAKSRDVEVLEKKSQYLEFGGNLVPVTKSGEQLQLQFQAFRENRLPFAVRVKDPHQEPLGRLAFMRQPRAARASEPPQAPLCNLNIALPEYEASQNLSELVTLEKKYGFVEETGLAKPELIHRADLRLSDIARELGSDWAALAAQLDVPEQDVASIRTECPSDLAQQALLMLRLWMKRAGGRATGNNLEKGLRMINREDIVNKCMFNVELVTDDVEKAVAKVHLDQSGRLSPKERGFKFIQRNCPHGCILLFKGFDTFREELGTPKDTSLKRDASLDVSYDEQDLMKGAPLASVWLCGHVAGGLMRGHVSHPLCKEAESAEETSSETGSVHERHTGSEAKGTSKTIPGVRKGSPISPTVGRIVRGSSKEKTAPQMAVEETFEEEPVVKSESAEATQQAASGAGPTAPPRDAKRKSKKEKTAPGPDYSLPRIRDTPERAFESATDATAVSSVRESTSRESTPEGKAKKKKEKKEKSPSPPGPDYTLPRLRDLYTPPRDVPLTSGPPEEDLSEASLARKSKERSLSPGSLRTAENGSLGTEPLGEREAKREPRGSEDTIVEKVERVVKETPGKIVEMVHIKRQRSSKSPEGKGTPKDKKKKGFPSSDVDTPDAAGESKDVPSDSTEAKKKQKMEKESSPTKHRSKDVKEVPGDVDKEGEFSAPDGKSPDSSFLSKMAKKMFPRGGRASASDEEPSSISESSPVSKKKAGKLPKSATLPKASEKSSKMPTHGIKSVDVEVDASKLALKGTKDVPAMDADDLETSTGDVVKDSDGRFFSKMAKIPKRMFPRSSKTSSSEDEPSSASESISAAKQKGKKEPKGEISSKKKDKSLKIKQPDSKTLSGSFAVGVDKDRSSPGKEDVDAKGHDREKSPGAKLGLKIGSIEKSLPHVKVGGSVERPEGKTLDIKPLHKEPQLSDERELSGKLSSDIELSLSSKEPTVDLPEATEESFDIGTPEHGKSSKGGFMHKMAKLPRKMFSHGFKGDASVEEPSAGHEGKSVSGPELEFKLDAKASDMKGPDGVPAKEITTSQPGTIDIKAPQSDVHLKMKGKIPEKPGAKVDIAFPTKKLAVGVPYGAEKHEYQVDQAEIRASFPDRPEAGVEIPGKQISVDFPEGRDEKIEISGQGIGKPSDVGFMSKVAKLPKKMLSYGSKEDGSADEEPGAVGDVHFKMPQGHIKVDVKGSEKPDLKGDIEVPGKKATVGMPEGIEGRVELSAPEVAKPSDGGFMSKMAKLPKKMFPHGSKGGVSVEGEAGIAGDVHVKMPEAHLQVGAEGLEKPEAELDIALPKKKVGVDLPDVDGKVEISGPEFSKSPDGGFISKMAKLPKKMFPHGTKDVSVEGEPGDIHIKMPEAHLKVGIEGLEKPEGEVDIALPEKQIDVDLPEGVEGKFEVSGPEFGRSSDGGFISKMANLPKKMFPHGTKDVSVEKGPEVGDIHVEMPEARLKVDVEGLKKPEIDVELPKKKVGVDLPEEVEGKVEISGPDFDKSSDGGFMSKMAKLPKKMFSHGAKDVSVERGPEVGDIHIKMPEAGLKVDVEGLEKPEIDVDLSRKKVGVDLPEGVEGKVEMSGPEFDKLSDGTFMSKMAKFPKKMFPHGSKDVSLEGEPEVGDIHVKMPEAHLKVGVEGLKKPEADVDIALPQKEIDVDLPEGVEGKIDISGPEFGKSSDGGFISKMAKLPKKMFPHGSKGGVSVEGEAGIAGDVHVKMPEAHLQVGAEGLEKPEAELDIALPKKKVGVDLPDVDGKVEISGPEFSKSPDGGFISKMAKLPKKMFPHGTKDVSVEGEPGDIHVKMPEAHLKVGIEGLEKPEGEVDIALPEKQIDVDLPEGVEGKFEVSAQGVGKPSDTGFMSKMTKFPKKMFPHGTKGVSVEEEHEVDGIQVKMPEAHLKVGVKGLEKPEAEVDVTLPKKKVGVDIPEGVEGKVELPAPQVGKSSDKGFMSKMAKLPKKMFPHGSKGVSVEEEHKVGSVHVKTPEAHLKMGAKGLEKPEAELDVTLPKKKVGVDLPEGVEGKVELTAPEVPKQSDKGFMSKMKKMFPHSPKGVSGDKELEVGDVQAKMPEAHLKVGVKGFGKPEVRGGIPSPKKKVSVDLPEPVDGKVELSAPELGKSLEGGITSKMAKVPKKKFPLGSKGVASIEGAPGDVHVKIPEAHLMSDVSGMEKPEAEVDISFSDQKVDVDLPGSIEGKVELTAPEVGKPSDGGFMSKMAKLPKKMFPHGSKGGISVEEVPEVGGVHVEMPEAHLKLGVKGLEKPETEVDISIPDEKVDVDFPGGFEGKVELTGPEVGKQPDGGFMSKMAKIPKKMFPHGPKGGVSVEGELEVGDVQGSVPEAHLKMGVGGLEKPQADVDIALPKEEVEVGLPEGVGGKVELSAPELGKSVEGGFMSKMAKFPKKMFPHGSKGGVSVEEAPGGVGDVNVKMPEAHLKLGAKGPEKPDTEVDITLPDKKIDVDLPGEFEGKVELTAPEIGKPSDGGFMSKMAKLPKKMFPHGSKGGISVEEELQGVGDANVKMPEAHLKLDVAGVEKPEAEVGISLPDQKIDVDLPGGIEGEVQLKASEVGKSVDGKIASKMAKLPKKMFSHASKEEPLGDAHIKVPEAQLKFDVKGPEKPGAEVDISLPDKKVDVELPGGIEGKVEITAPEVGKSDKGFMSKMAKFPKKMFSHGSKGGSSVEEAPDGVGDVHVKIPEAHLKLDVKGLEKPEPELEKVDADFPGGIEGKVEFTSPEVGKSSDKGFMSKMAKLPKKMFPHGSKGGVSVAETSGGFGDLDVEMPEAHLKVDVKGPEKPEAHLDASLPDQKVDVGAPEGIGGKVELSAPEVGKPSDSGFMAKVAKLPKKMFPHGTKGSISVEEGAEITGDVHVEMPGARLNVEGLQKPDAEVDISLPEERLAVGLPEGVEGKVEVSAPEVGKSSPADFLSKMAKVPKKMFPLGSGGLSVEEESRVGDIHLEMPEAHLKASVEGLEKPGVEVDVAFPEKKGELPKGIQGKVEVSAPEVDKPSDGGFMSKMTKKIFSHGSKGGVSVEETSGVIGDVGIKMPEAHVKLDVKGLEKPETEAELSVRADFPGGPKGKGDMPAAKIGKPSDGALMSAETKLPEGALPDGHKAGGSIEGTLVTGKDFGADIPGVLKVEATAPKMREVDVEFSRPIKEAAIERPDDVAAEVEMGTREAGKAPDKGFISKMAKLPKKMFHHGSKGGTSTDEHSEPAEGIDVKTPELSLKLQTEVKVPHKPEDVSVSLHGKEVTVQLPEESERTVELSTRELGKHSDKGFLSKMAKFPKKMFSYSPKANISGGEPPDSFDNVHDKVTGLKVHAETDLQYKEEHANIVVPTKKVSGNLLEKTVGTVEVGTPELGQASDGHPLSRMSELPKVMLPQVPEPTLVVEQPLEACQGLRVETPGVEKRRIDVETSAGSIRDSELFRLKEKGARAERDWEVGVDHKGSILEEPLLNVQDTDISLSEQGPHKEGLGKVPEQPCAVFGVSLQGQEVAVDLTEEQGASKFGEESGRGVLPQAKNIPKEVLSRDSKEAAALEVSLRHNKDTHFKGPQTELNLTGGVGPRKKAESDLQAKKGYAESAVVTGEMGTVEIGSPELGKQRGGSIMSKIAKLPKKVFRYSSRGEVATVSAGASGGSLKIKSPERTNVKLGTSSPGGKMNQGVLEASLLGPEKPSGGTVAPAALADVKISEVPKCHLDASVHPEITSTAPPECTGESTNGASPDHSKPPRRALETAMAEFPEKAILLGSEGVNSGAAEADFERQRKSLEICTTDVHASVPKAEVAVEVPQVAFVLPQHEALLNESLVSDLPELSTAGVSIHKTPAVFGNVRGQICHLHHKTPEAEIDGSVSDSIITDCVGFRGDVEISAPKHARPSVKPDTGSPPVSDADAWAVELIDVRIPKPEARVQVNVGIHDEPHELSEGAMSVKKTSADLSDIPCETVSKHTVRSKFSDDDATVPLKENISFEASSWPSEASGSQAPGSAEHFKAGVSVMEKPLREDAGNVQEVSRGTVDIIAPKLGKPKKRGFMSKMAKFPPKMFSRGSKEIASVEKPSVSTEGTDLSISRSGAHTKEGVKVAEKPKDIVDASQSEARISVDVLDDSQKRIGKASTPERSQSQEKGLIGKMSKLPKKMFSHGSKRGAVKEEFPVGGEDASCKIVGSEGFGAMTVSDEKGELDNNLSEQKAFEERPERCKDTANVILPTTGHSSMRTLSEMTKLQENVVPHGPKVHDTVEMPYVGSEGVFPDVLATIPSRETDISLIGKAMAVDIPESHEAAIDLCVADHKILTQELAPLKMGERPGLKESLEIRQPGPVAGVSANSEKVASAGVQLEKFSKFPSTADSEVSYTSRATGENFVTKLTKAPSKQPLDSEGVVLFNGSSGKHFEAPVVDSTGLQKIHSSEEGFMSKECRTDIQEPSVRLRVTEIDIKPITKASDFAEVPKGDQKLFELAPRFFDVDPCAATEIPQMAMLKEQKTFEEELFAEPPEPVRGTGKPEGDKRAVVSEGSLKTPGGSVKVVKVMAHGITTIPKGAPGLQSEKISEMFPSDRSTGIFEGDLATSTNVVHVTKHEIGKHLKPLRAEKRAKGEVQSYYDQEQGLVMEAHKIVTRSKHTETPGAFIEVLDVTAHDVEKPRDDSFISVKSKGPVRLTPRSGKVTELPASAERSSKPAGEQIEDSRIFVAVGVPDKPSADILPAGTELPITARRETKETPGGVIEVVEVTTHEVSKPASPGLLSKVSKIPKKIFPRGSKSKGSDEESPSAAKRELRETPGGLVEVVEVTKHDVTRHPESKHSPHDDATGAAVEPAMLRAEPGSLMQSPPTLEEREIREVPGGVVEVVRVTKHIVGRLPEDKHADTLGAVPLGTPLSLEAELAKDPSAVVKREVKETPEGHVEVVQVIRREVGDVPFGDDFPGDRESGGTISRRIETTVVEGKPTVIRRLVTTTADGVQHVTENIEQGAEDVGSVASSLFAKMGDFAKGLSSGDSSAVTTREVKQLPGGGIEVVSITKQSSSSPERGISSTQQLPGDASELPSSTGSMHFAESAAGQPMEAKTTIIRREISGPETVVRTTTSIVTSATAPGSSKPDLSADDLDKMFGDMEPPKVDERLKDVLTGGYRAKREVTPEEAELLAQLFPEQSSETASYPPAGLVPEAAIIPEYRGMTTAEGAPPQDPESKEKVLLKLGRALSQDDLDAPSPTRGEAAMAVAGLGEGIQWGLVGPFFSFHLLCEWFPLSGHARSACPLGHMR
ncbi:hypothetical protein HPB48_006837 [Haemaphysalis longicornis]|uniref:Death domain-containing protein n=1 Tax=Haemaphysalis longicornis TaxID=44386 RepID=A0A9J6FED1_HAELO|nr:hypothetical protein HPB48_006837 [Haemaphysalis longicornis]